MGTKVQKVAIPLLKSVWSMDRERVEYPCTFVGEHCAVLRLIGWRGQEKRRWQVTHRPTGWKMGASYPTKAKAIEYAKRVEARALRLGIPFGSRSGKVIEKHPKIETLRKYGKKLNAELLGSPV